MKNKDEKNTMTESPDVIIGEVLPDEKADGKKKQLVPRKSDNVAFGSFITKSNDLIQRTKYSLPRNEQKILFMMLSKIDQRHDMDASKYYTISFDDFAKLTGVNALDSGYANYLRKTIENLENRMFWVPLGNDQYKTMSWVNRGSIVDMKKKTISMRFNPDIWKDIAQLTSNYTSYSIEYLLMMQSTYSMRVYEIILSYDNGNRDYSYNNGLIFEPVTEEVLQKFPNKREELKGFKYKRFDMEEFKGMLSMPTRDEINRSKGKSRDSSAQKFSRDKPLTEKYKVFSDFEKNVLAMVKSEINEMTDLWFDYEPVRRRGVRKYEFLYIFIKYKNREEMKSVRAFHQEHKGADTEVSRKPRKRRSSVSEEALEQYNQPLSETILTTTYRLARNELAVKAQYQTYEEKLTPEERNIFIDIFTYTSKILTNTKKRDQAEETLEALNRIIKDNDGLKTWALGMSVKYKAMLERAKERKSAQYYRTVVYNDIIENSAAIIADGTKRAALLDGDRTDLFKFDWSQFDE